jgi:hypothetical protein
MSSALRNDASQTLGCLAMEAEKKRMTTQEKRKHIRIKRVFRTKLSKDGMLQPAVGKTENVSQGGAYIRTKHWHSFKPNDKTTITVYLPPIFSGQDGTIGLQGSARITRVDEDNEGVAVQFLQNFKQFERIEEMDIPGKIRYKNLAHYLSATSSIPAKSFAEMHPDGFLVEKTQKSMDKEVIFQFSTKSFEDEEVLRAQKQGVALGDILEARVIEIKERKESTTASHVTIGRAAQNDIILYNKMISKDHAYLEIPEKGGNCSLVDVGSKNGTLLNGDEVTPNKTYPLKDGDEISFGPETKVVYFSSRTFHEFLTQLKTPSG